MRIDADRALETEMPAVRGKAFEEVDQCAFVAGCGRAEAQRRAVSQNDVLPYLGQGHVATLADLASKSIRQAPRERCGHLLTRDRFRPDSAAVPPRHDRGVELRRPEMKPIVLATDGSPSAAEATLTAVELAKALGAPLVAVSVEHVVVPGY